MSKLFEIIQGSSAEAWLGTLPEYQRKNIYAILDTGKSYDEVADIWVNTSIASTSPFSASGAEPRAKGYSDKIKAEFKAFICGDTKYEKERSLLAENSDTLKTTLVSAIAVAITPYIGASAVVIIPIVALMLSTLSTISINAWCALASDSIS